MWIALCYEKWRKWRWIFTLCQNWNLKFENWILNESFWLTCELLWYVELLFSAKFANCELNDIVWPKIGWICNWSLFSAVSLLNFQVKRHDLEVSLFRIFTLYCFSEIDWTCVKYNWLWNTSEIYSSTVYQSLWLLLTLNYFWSSLLELYICYRSYGWFLFLSFFTCFLPNIKNITPNYLEYVPTNVWQSLTWPLHPQHFVLMFSLVSWLSRQAKQAMQCKALQPDKPQRLRERKRVFCFATQASLASVF